MNNFIKSLFSILFLIYSTEFIAQSNSVNAGEDQLICPSTSTNLSMAYTAVNETSSYLFSEIPYSPSSFTDGSNALPTSIDDLYSPIIPIGFCFQFYGVPYTQCVIGTNGLISFDLTKSNQYCPYSYTASLPSPVLPTNSIMSPYHDIDPSINKYV